MRIMELMVVVIYVEVFFFLLFCLFVFKSGLIREAKGFPTLNDLKLHNFNPSGTTQLFHVCKLVVGPLL